MKLKTVSCTQFAGARDRELSFADGLNVIYGRNESGKSTLVNLISRTLFQNAQLDRRSDKGFYELYFPAARKNGALMGDYADGKLSFEAQNRLYTLSKEWGADSRCLLSTAEGALRDNATVDEVLKKALVYGEGVYADMLFSSQRNTDASLQALLDASKKTDAKQELTEAVSRAFAETDGVSLDTVEQAINDKIDEIAGKHWDFERNIPLRNRTGMRWSKGVGEVLTAYYELEEAKAAKAELTRLELALDSAANDYAAKNAAAKSAEEALNAFEAYAGLLAVQTERRKTLQRLQTDLAKLEAVLDAWPKLENDLEIATALQNELTKRALADKYAAAARIEGEISALNALVAERPCPTQEEIARVKAAQRSITTLENKLCGMNLNALINVFGDNSVELVSLRTGERVEISDGAVTLTEAVKLTVPGVMEMQLSPADVDVSLVEASLAEQRAIVERVLSSYSVASLEALETLARTVSDANAGLESANAKLSLILGGEAYTQLEKRAEAISEPIRSKAEIDADIRALCTNGDISKFITARETMLDGYIAEYESLDELKNKAALIWAEHEKSRLSLAQTADIPAEYLIIVDPERHLEQLKTDLKNKQLSREAALTAKTAAVSRLESYGESLAADCDDRLETAERVFEEKKELLAHWRHIAEVFYAQKELINENPMQNLADCFARYLAVITGGTLSSDFPRRDKIDVSIYSDDRILDYSKLSEGTKETVSLAFRLAVLEHLFPDGGGVIILDDPLTDMDDIRIARSCELIKQCATRHQVIFLTCKEQCRTLLGGNEIEI